MRVDRIFEGGTLLTMDRARPRATALAVLRDRIVAVGDGDELRRHLDAERVVSLEGRTVVPGFHDAHNHMVSFGIHDMFNQRALERRFRTASGQTFNAAEALTADEAIRCYTLHSARVAFREDDLGSL